MTRKIAFSHVALAAVAAGALLAAPSARADEVADFYKGKTLNLIISTGVGGSNNVNARLLLRHMVKYIPGNPDFVAKNMPGGGHIRAANYLYNVAPKDGSHIGALVRFYVLHQALGGKSVKYDARKYNYLGSTGNSNVVAQAWKEAGFDRIEQVFEKELIVGGTGTGSGTVIFPTVLNALLDTKFKIVSGYKSGHEIDLAMERGEVQGRIGNTFEAIRAVNPAWLKDGSIRILLQIGLEKEPGQESIPLALDLVKDEQKKRILALYSGVVSVGSPIFTTPGVPADRVAALRKAFDATMKDPAYLAEAEKVRFEITPTSADKLTRIVTDIVDAPAEVLRGAREVVKYRNLVKCSEHTDSKYCAKVRKKKKKEG
ncbi:MAG: hypothetical protein GEU92_13765 [Alphaproteobacteria bacterium]|nr:hypothetical protein [Alphaproteobacteria bacterium]